MEVGSKMKKFMDEDFLLESETAKVLFHNYAKKMPIVDFHNHLSCEEIYENKQYRNLTEVWLTQDHYKWRQLRTNGIPESIVTGNCSDDEKYAAWAKTVPSLIGNPLYHWTHLELKRYFHIDDVLNEKTAADIYEKCNACLQTKDYFARGLLEQMNVEVLCTTDDPCDDLRYHKALKEEGYQIKVLPTFRPDNAVHIEKPTFCAYIEKLATCVGSELRNVQDVVTALKQRLAYFIEVGCVITDHGLDRVLYENATFEEANAIYLKGLNKECLNVDELRKYKGYVLHELGIEYAKQGLVMQLHMGTLRNNSTRLFNQLGADSGFDSMNDHAIAEDLSRFLDSLDKEDALPKTILYTINPKDNEMLASMIGNFQSGIPGKVQFGSGWWFNDQKDGMERQMEALMQLGMISKFVGMLTDSRSFLSFPRHEYFRRILCNKIANLIESGQYPNDIEYVGQMIKNICYHNSKNYFGL